MRFSAQLTWGLSPRVRGNRLPPAGVEVLDRSIPARAGEPRTGTPAGRWPRVYPRACGGTGALDQRLVALNGLSPRVRGNLERERQDKRWGRSIPARAGEPRLRNRPSAATEVYPRACGGTDHALTRRAIRAGLSPRVRGNHVRRGHRGATAGSIPARAGEPPTRATTHGSCTVYPRACGGTAGAALRFNELQGLSPRVRGNLLDWTAANLDTRSIPARAGEPFDRHAHLSQQGVYPRACGGTLRYRTPTASRLGLSPRVRGNHVDDDDPTARMRSIPARAGEPQAHGLCGKYAGVYPRACGGTLGGRVIDIDRNGLSPRVRGNRSGGVGLQLPRRSIPARAGEPASDLVQCLNPEVYPRACGGTTRGQQLHGNQQGLSPRVRGNLECDECGETVNGSIPARAGEPINGQVAAKRAGVYPRACGGTSALGT